MLVSSVLLHAMSQGLFSTNSLADDSTKTSSTGRTMMSGCISSFLSWRLASGRNTTPAQEGTPHKLPEEIQYPDRGHCRFLFVDATSLLQPQMLHIATYWSFSFQQIIWIPTLIGKTSAILYFHLRTITEPLAPQSEMREF